MEQITCPHCGRPNPNTHNFCAHCGRRLVEFCPRCGFHPESDASFCGNCGLGLTPRSQFLHWPSATPDGHWPLASPAPLPETAIGAGTPEATPEEPAAAAPPAQHGLEQYVPRELMAKLEAARARGKMFGERRVVTMLFCDVKGSTSAAGNLDPEEWTEIINGAFEYMIRPVYKYEGMVARLMGDGILAFFGAPIAHEDDPSRAVLAGLEIVDGLAPYREKIEQQWGLEVEVRVGINTGLVVVGAVGSDLRMEYTAMGDAINLAARMEQTAAPGTVQIAHDTYKQVMPLFDFEELGGIEVKGKEDPIPAYRVLGRKAAAGRKRGIEGLESDLIGRGRELERLASALANLERGIGRIVCLLGGAGLGKSRLLREVRRGLPEDSAVNWYEVASLSYESSYPYVLFQKLLRRMIGISATEDTDHIWEKIRLLAVESPNGDETRYARLFAALFGLPEPTDRPPLEGEQFKRELYAIMPDLWQAFFATQPAVLVLDDLHWADAASIDLLLHLLPVVEACPLLLICAFRPDRGAPSYRVRQAADTEYPHRYTEINLRPLSEAESDEMIDSLLAIAELPDDLRARIYERAAGNPFYVEEVVRTLIEKGALVAEERPVNGTENGGVRRYWRAASEEATIDIPENLQGLLTSRIDRLEEETRHVLQLASVIGRSFYRRVLAEIGRQDELSVSTVEQQTGRLVRLEMIQEAARVPDVEYRFRNPMMQEIAYQTILLKRRREFHRRVGAALETLFPDRLSELAPRLAYHYAEGRQAQKALAHYLLAGDQAFRLFALEEALHNYDQALQWADQGAAVSGQLIHLYQRRGRVLELMLRHHEAMETYQALEALGDARDDDAVRLAGILAQGIAFTVTTYDLEKSREYTDRAIQLARDFGDPYSEARGLWGRLLAYTWFDSQQALAAGEQGLAICRKLVAGPDTTQDHLDLLALILMDLTMPLMGTGKVQTAAEYAAEARQLFDEFGNLPMVATAAQRQGLAYRVQGQYEQAREAFAGSFQIDESIGNAGGLMGSSLGLFEVYSTVGDFSAHFATIERTQSIVGHEDRLPLRVYELQPLVIYVNLGLPDRVLDFADEVWSFKESGTYIWPDLSLCCLARAYIKTGDLESGRKCLAAISKDLELNNYMMPLAPHVPQAKAELALAAGEWQEALSLVEPYVTKARQDGMLSFLPEKLLLLADIQCAAGQPDTAYETLQEAHALALEQNARPVLWRVCGRLAGMEEERGNDAVVSSIYADARAAIDFIADHAGGEDLRASFLALPPVQSILKKTGG